MIARGSWLRTLLGLCPVCFPGCVPEAEVRDRPELEHIDFGGAMRLGVPELPEIRLQFSSEIAASALIPENFAIVPFEPTGEACAQISTCSAGLCVAGACQQSPINDALRSRADRGALADGVPLKLRLMANTEHSEQTVVSIQPTEPLQPEHRYVLLWAASVHSSDGAPVAGGSGSAEFHTAPAGSSGPRPRLVWPTAGAIALPLGTRILQTAFAQPVESQTRDRLLMSSQTGDLVSATASGDCPGWLPSTCVEWRLDAGSAFNPFQRYGLRGTTTRDQNGRTWSFQDPEQWLEFSNNKTTAELPTTLHLERRGACLHISAPTGSVPQDLELRVNWIANIPSPSEFRRWSIPAPMAIRLPSTGEPRGVEVHLRDTSDRRWQGVFPIDDSPPPEAAWIISEILANPAGREPQDEFVELVAASDQPATRLALADLPWSAILEQVSEGEVPGHVFDLPPVSAGTIVVLVGPNHASLPNSEPPNPDDVAFPAGLQRIVLPGEIGQGGLKNGGEPLSLYDPNTMTLISSFTPIAEGPAPTAGQSWQRKARRLCDLPRNWQLNPEALASPGRLP